MLAHAFDVLHLGQRHGLSATDSARLAEGAARGLRRRRKGAMPPSAPRALSMPLTRPRWRALRRPCPAAHLRCASPRRHAAMRLSPRRSCTRQRSKHPSPPEAIAKALQPDAERAARAARASCRSAACRRRRRPSASPKRRSRRICIACLARPAPAARPNWSSWWPALPVRSSIAAPTSRPADASYQRWTRRSACGMLARDGDKFLDREWSNGDAHGSSASHRWPLDADVARSPPRRRSSCAVMPGEDLVATLHAQGAQVYECKADAAGASGSGSSASRSRRCCWTARPSAGTSRARPGSSPTAAWLTGKVSGSAPGATVADIPHAAARGRLTARQPAS